MERDDQALKDFIGPDGEVVVPHAVLDTNVMLSTYSWHDLVRAMDLANTKDPNSSLHDADIQFRAQQLRWGFLLSLFLDEKKWFTICPVAEFKRKLACEV